MQLNINSKIKLNNGVEIPYLGLGTYRITSQKEVDVALNSAFETGYRLIDTAAAYGNEKEIGKTLRNSTIPREEIFITTKLDNTSHGYKQALNAFGDSLRNLDCGYIDLYLIHWPVEDRNESWRAMEELLDSGRCRSIGVSNYMIKHLKDIPVSSVIPAVNQIEFNPFVIEENVLGYCRDRGIAVEAYTPITKGKRFNHPELKKLAEKYGKTVAQIMLRWSIQQNVIVIPKSSSPERIKENADIFDFEIDKDDMEVLNSLDESLRSSPDPHKF